MKAIVVAEHDPAPLPGMSAAPLGGPRWRRGARTRSGRSAAPWKLARRGVVVGTLAGLVLAAPASWVDVLADRASAGHLRLADAQGTLWNGDAIAVLTGGAGSQDASQLPGRLAWKLRPAWTGLKIELTHPGHLLVPLDVTLSPRFGGARVALRPQAGSASAQAAQGRWPAAWLTGLGTPFNTLQPEGQLEWRSPAGLSFETIQGRLTLDGSMVLDILDFSSRVAPVPVLGSYRLTLQGGGGAAVGAQGAPAATLQLQTLDGALRLSGQGQHSGQRWRFRGEASAAPGQEMPLSNLLNIIGRRQGATSQLAIG